ncbi:DNA-binding helix-turn-helix protein [Clostridiales bacterium oral taxon 876 str. F0540]|nr:DNA-binding helix-turn-helix protein [Clostridiales bacterium oral taxon 876 str. F0540]
MKGSGNLQTKIQDLRKARKVTQSELADAVNVTRQTIISLENGKYNASLVLAHKIAQFFGVTIEEVFIFDMEDENL